MFYNPMGMPSGKTFWCGGFYNHSLVRTADGWKSQRLIEESSWFDRQSEAMGPAAPEGGTAGYGTVSL